MKTLTVLIFTLFSTTFIHAQESIVGIYNTGKANTKVEITEVNGVYEGKIIASDNAKVQIGRQLLKDFKKIDGEWNGQLYAAQQGKWMNAILEEKNNQLIITVKRGKKSKKLKWKKE